MARSNGDFPGHLLIVAQRAFVVGCSGCIGVASAALVVFVLVFGVFQPQFVALVRAIAITPLPIVINLQPVSTIIPVQTQVVTEVEVFVTAENVPEAPRITVIKVPIRTPLFVCVRVQQAIRVSVRITLPSGQVISMGEVTTDPSGKAVCIGPMPDLSSVQGAVRIEVLTGTTVVGSTVLNIEP